LNRPLPAATRLAVAGVWAIVVGGLMYALTAALDLPDSDLVLIASLGGLGAAVYIVFLAGGP
jgi:hypothetical protein